MYLQMWCSQSSAAVVPKTNVNKIAVRSRCCKHARGGGGGGGGGGDGGWAVTAMPVKIAGNGGIQGPLCFVDLEPGIQQIFMTPKTENWLHCKEYARRSLTTDIIKLVCAAFPWYNVFHGWWRADLENQHGCNRLI